MSSYTLPYPQYRTNDRWDPSSQANTLLQASSNDCLALQSILLTAPDTLLKDLVKPVYESAFPKNGRVDRDKRVAAISRSLADCVARYPDLITTKEYGALWGWTVKRSRNHDLYVICCSARSNDIIGPRWRSLRWTS